MLIRLFILGFFILAFIPLVMPGRSLEHESARTTILKLIGLIGVLMLIGRLVTFMHWS